MRRTTAASLMEPLRVVLGARMRLTDAVRRLDAHRTVMAPVVISGAPVGILTRRDAEHAMRMGGGALTAGEMTCGGAPKVSGGAGLPEMNRLSQGVAPGLIVSGPGRVVEGMVSRRRLSQISGAAGRNGRDLRQTLVRLMSVPHVRLLRRAGALAVERGVCLHLAGGVVRDVLMGRTPRDLDLVVEGDGIAFASRLSQELGGKLTRHERFGTAVIHVGPVTTDFPAGLRIDVATARQEAYAHPAALPLVEPGTIVDDILRRDVTINSMTIRLDGRRFGILVDAAGGQRDLRRHVLQVLHRMSLVDDPTRAFRIARFAARFGFAQTEDTKSSLNIARQLGAFQRLGGERLQRELVLIASEPAPWTVWGQCAAMGLLSEIGPALRWHPETRRHMERLFRGIREEKPGMDLAEVDRPLVMLMLLARGASPASRRELAARLKLSGGRAARLEQSGQQLRALTRILSRGADAGRVARCCEEAAPEMLALTWAMGGPAASAIGWYLRELRNIRPTLTGAALREMGLPAGPRYAAVLARLRAALLNRGIRTVDEERALAIRLVRRMSRER